MIRVLQFRTCFLQDGLRLFIHTAIVLVMLPLFLLPHYHQYYVDCIDMKFSFIHHDRHLIHIFVLFSALLFSDNDYATNTK